MKHTSIELINLFTPVDDQESLEEIKTRLIWERRILREIIDNLPSSIYIKDSKGRKILANKANYQRSGFQNEADVVGKTDFEMFPEEIAKKFHEDDNLVLQKGQVIKNREELVIANDGEKHWQITEKLPLEDDSGKIVGLVGFGHDITSEKNLELEKTEAAARMHQQNAMVENMIRELSEIPEKIGDLVGGIANIAKQTKMLAINAAIEAARVGEHGRGFEIVAREVGDLSDKSSQATDQVRDAIEEVISLVQKIMDLWEEVKQA